MHEDIELQEPDPPPLMPVLPNDCEQQHAQNAGVGNEEVSQHDLVHSMTQLMQAQTSMLTAHAQAVAMQSLPSLPPFNGEDNIGDEDNFDKWLELLEERGRLAGWSEEQYLCQLRAHLTRTAQQIFRMLKEEERKSYSAAVAALKKRFRPIDIEELRGIEFHHKMQNAETIEQLGIDLQKLARKAFPELCGGKEFDRLLKGRFFQALLPKWQRKLGAPKPEESFAEIYDRARMLEKHEVQYAASAAVRRDTKVPHTDKRVAVPDHNQRRMQHGKQRFQRTHRVDTPSVNVQTTGNKDGDNSVQTHKPSGAPPSNKSGGSTTWTRAPSHRRSEAPGRGKPSSLTSAVTPVSVVSTLEQLSDKQLEDILAKRRLEKERELMKDAVHVDTVFAEESSLGAVGPILSLNVKIEGVSINAMVDTGSQSTVISRSILHKIVRHLKSQGKELPSLQKPSLQLYGKGGKDDKNELHISAETQLTIEADGHKVNTTVFVQPDSEQSLLLGTNATLPLKLKFLNSNGEPLQKEMPKSARVAKVSLIETTTIPPRKGRFIEACLDQKLIAGEKVLFEPKLDTLKNLGLSSMESLLTVNAAGNLLIPLQNFQQSPTNAESGIDLGRAELFIEQEMGSIFESNTCAHVTTQTHLQMLTILQTVKYG